MSSLGCFGNNLCETSQFRFLSLFPSELWQVIYQKKTEILYGLPITIGLKIYAFDDKSDKSHGILRATPMISKL